MNGGKIIQSVKFLRCYVTESGGGRGSKVVTRRYMGKGAEILQKLLRNLWMAPQHFRQERWPKIQLCIWIYEQLLELYYAIFMTS